VTLLSSTQTQTHNPLPPFSASLSSSSTTNTPPTSARPFPLLHANAITPRPSNHHATITAKTATTTTTHPNEGILPILEQHPQHQPHIHGPSSCLVIPVSLGEGRYAFTPQPQTCCVHHSYPVTPLNTSLRCGISIRSAVLSYCTTILMSFIVRNGIHLEGNIVVYMCYGCVLCLGFLYLYNIYVYVYVRVCVCVCMCVCLCVCVMKQMPCYVL